jgi:hypothetical protein
MSDQPPITTPTQLAAEVRDAILKHTPAEKFAEVFGTLPPATQKQLARKYSPQPALQTVKNNRHQK